METLISVAKPSRLEARLSQQVSSKGVRVPPTSPLKLDPYCDTRYRVLPSIVSTRALLAPDLNHQHPRDRSTTHSQRIASSGDSDSEFKHSSWRGTKNASTSQRCMQYAISLPFISPCRTHHPSPSPLPRPPYTADNLVCRRYTNPTHVHPVSAVLFDLRHGLAASISLNRGDRVDTTAVLSAQLTPYLSVSGDYPST